MATCPICKAEVGELDPEHLVVGFICPTHGRFRVSRAALAMPRLMNAPREQWEAALKRAKAYAPSDVWAACITSYHFDERDRRHVSGGASTTGPAKAR